MMYFAHMEKTSLLDFPGRICSLLYTIGCNFRCPFCYNRSLVLPEEYPPKNLWLDEDYVISVLEERKRYIRALAITGGEPLLHPEIIPFFRRVRERGFAIKIDTNGTFPDRLKEILDEGLVDYVAMDVKNSPKRYSETTGVDVDLSKVERSIKILKESGIDHEFRTTLVPGLHTVEDLKEMVDWMGGCRKLILQPYRNDMPLINPEFNKKVLLTDEEVSAFKRGVEETGLCDEVIVRSYY